MKTISRNLLLLALACAVASASGSEAGDVEPGGISINVQIERARFTTEENGPVKFWMGDIKFISSFVKKLKHPADEVSVFLAGKLSHQTREAVMSYTGLTPPLDTKEIPVHELLATNLNMVIEGGPIYDAKRFAKAALRTATKALLAQNPKGDALVLLNRMLLEDAYPSEIRRRCNDVLVLDLVLDSNYPAPLLVSVFDLHGVLANTRFENESGRGWAVGATGGSPPPTEVDYCLLVEPGKPYRTGFTLALPERVKREWRAEGNNQIRPTRFAYTLKGVLSTLEKGFEKHHWIKCEGKGHVSIPWPPTE